MFPHSIQKEASMTKKQRILLGLVITISVLTVICGFYTNLVFVASRNNYKPTTMSFDQSSTGLGMALGILFALPTAVAAVHASALCLCRIASHKRSLAIPNST